jgi:hypothetical protein
MDWLATAGFIDQETERTTSLLQCLLLGWLMLTLFVCLPARLPAQRLLLTTRRTKSVRR